MQTTAFSPRSLERARGVNKVCYVHPEWHGDVLCAFSMTWVCVMCAQHGMSMCHVPSAWPGFHNTATLQSVNTDRHHQRGLGEVQSRGLLSSPLLSATPSFSVTNEAPFLSLSPGGRNGAKLI